jgi:hypothetical protein
MIRWPLRHSRESKSMEAPCIVDIRYVELETAKEILSEIFRIRPNEVDQMIHTRLEDRRWAAEKTPLREDGLWPATFYLEG